jgi:histidine triad (HIT) family protein
MQITPEMKAQLEEQKKQCIFCKIISGDTPGKKVFEDNKTIAVLDIYPALKGHTVFMLKEHYPMPAYIPGDEFKHKFSLVAPLAKAIKSGMVRTAMDVFVAIGGAAGQQSYHFLIHFLPRDEEDGFLNFLFEKGEKLDEGGANMLKQNFPIMMKNHFGRNPASWHSGEGERPSHLQDVYDDDTVIYEDEKMVCVIPAKNAAKGHLIIYSKAEEKYVENLLQEDSSHLFFAASLASTAVFEGLQAQASNIILKSGETDDNPDGKLAIHILPRWQDDNLKKLVWEPKQPSYDLDTVAKDIEGKTWKVKYEKVEVKKEVVKIEVKNSSEEEIMKAIEALRW